MTIDQESVSYTCPPGPYSHLSPSSQLVLGVATGTAAAQILHCHDLDDKARPAREVLRALALARLRVVLLPREARLLPALVDGFDEVPAQAAVQIPCLGLVGAGLRGDIL